MNVRPLRNLAYVRKIRRTMTPSGLLHLPESFDHKARAGLKMGAVPDHFEAEVLAVGPLVKDIAPGSRVLVWTYAEGDGSKLFTGDGEQGDCLFIKIPDDIVCELDASKVEVPHEVSAHSEGAMGPCAAPAPGHSCEVTS